VLGRMPIVDQDSVPYASAGAGFVLQRAVGKVSVLDRDRPWSARATLDVNDAPDASPYAANPRSVLVTTAAKAYVARYASNRAKIVDVATGSVTGEVDFAPFVAAGDPDGLVEVENGVYDPASGRAYFVLQRIDQFDFSGTEPDYVGRCLPGRGLVVALDVATDTFVDLNGPASGLGIELRGVNPGGLVADLGARRLLVVEAGCYASGDGGGDGGPAPRVGRGIEAVDLAAATTSWLMQTAELPRLGGLVWADATHAFVAKGGRWYAWNPAEGALGAELVGFPQAPFSDGAGRVLGLAARQPDAGSDAGVTWSVVAWSVASGQLSELIARPFEGIQPATSFGVTSARLR